MAATCDSETSHEDRIRGLTVLNSYMIWSSCGSKMDQYSALWLKIHICRKLGQVSFILNSAQGE